MVNIKLESGWFLLENKVLFGASVPNKDYINLSLEKWDDIVTETLPYSLVEFQWEYDIDSVWIKALAGKDNRLNYLIKIKNKKYAIIQNPKILDNDEVSDMDYRLYIDEKVENKLDQLELEWKKIRLDAENWALQVDAKDDKKHEEVKIEASNTTWKDPEVEVD